MGCRQSSTLPPPIGVQKEEEEEEGEAEGPVGWAPPKGETREHTPPRPASVAPSGGSSSGGEKPRPRRFRRRSIAPVDTAVEEGEGEGEGVESLFAESPGVRRILSQQGRGSTASPGGASSARIHSPLLLSRQASTVGAGKRGKLGGSPGGVAGSSSAGSAGSPATPSPQLFFSGRRPSTLTPLNRQQTTLGQQQQQQQQQQQHRPRFGSMPTPAFVPGVADPAVRQRARAQAEHLASILERSKTVATGVGRDAPALQGSALQLRRLQEVRDRLQRGGGGGGGGSRALGPAAAAAVGKQEQGEGKEEEEKKEKGEGEGEVRRDNFATPVRQRSALGGVLRGQAGAGAAASVAQVKRQLEEVRVRRKDSLEGGAPGAASVDGRNGSGGDGGGGGGRVPGHPHAPMPMGMERRESFIAIDRAMWLARSSTELVVGSARGGADGGVTVSSVSSSSSSSVTHPRHSSYDETTYSRTTSATTATNTTATATNTASNSTNGFSSNASSEKRSEGGGGGGGAGARLPGTSRAIGSSLRTRMQLQGDTNTQIVSNEAVIMSVPSGLSPPGTASTSSA